jgi:hypothetical protein
MTEFWLDDQMVDKSSMSSKSPLATNTKEVHMGAVPNLYDYFKGAVACLQLFNQPLNAKQISVLKGACHPGNMSMSL